MKDLSGSQVQDSALVNHNLDHFPSLPNQVRVRRNTSPSCPLRPVEPAVLSTKVSGLKQKSKDRKVPGGRGNKMPTISIVTVRRGQSQAKGIETPTLTPPSDFLFNRLLAAVKTKRKIKSPALYPCPNLKSGSWIRKRLLCLKRGPGVS